MLGTKPDWLKVKVLNDANREKVENILKKYSLHTVCEQAGCPNIMECFCNKTATFLILGNHCTRNCSFCQVLKGQPQPVDPLESIHISEAVSELNLKHVVITSVTRDDLTDGGSAHFAQVIGTIRKFNPDVAIEVLIPDFKGDLKSVMNVIAAKPAVISHNIETIERLYPQVRPMANYTRSLELLKRVKSNLEIKTKSGLMVGLGETYDEVIQTMWDLRSIGCDFLTIGQYLAPSKHHHPVVEYIHPEVFEKYKSEAKIMGFIHTSSGPFVRSSYHASEALK